VQFKDRREADPSLIQNLASLFIFYDDLKIFELGSVHIHRDATRAGGTLHKNEPAPLVVGEA